MSEALAKASAGTRSRVLFLPGRVLFAASLLYMALGCVVFFFKEFLAVWILTGAGIIPFIIIDFTFLFFLGDRLSVKRIIPVSFAQGETVRVKLLIQRTGRLPVPAAIQLYDLYPDTMSAGAFPHKLNLRGNNYLKNGFVFEYSLLPNERGPWVFPGAEFLMASPMRFWQSRVTHEVTSSGRTYPNFKQLARGTELKGIPEKGEISQIRRRGQGMDFESLRDYHEGDSIKLIDWRATSRNRRLDGSLKLIVKNYQEEQDQQILFIIDSGYRLPDQHFDSALEAMLLLSYMALKHGDAVAAASFGARDLWIPPRKGLSAYTGLMNGLYDLHSAPVPSSPFLALENALSRLHRRSLIVLISNFREEDDRSLSWIIPRVQRRHLLLLVSFREDEAETLIFTKTDAAPRARTDEDTLESAAAFAYLANRRRLYHKWEHSGLLVLETSPKRISPALINKYLSLKKSGRF